MFMSERLLIDAYLKGFAMLAPTAKALVNNLAYLQLDLSEPALRAPTRAMFAAHEAALRSLLDEGVAAGELRVLDAASVARTLLSVVQGALIVWGVYRNGTVSAAIEREVRAVMGAYVTA